MKKNLTLPYSLHQMAYWATAAGIISFATAFLLEKGSPSPPWASCRLRATCCPALSSPFWRTGRTGREAGFSNG